MDKHSQGNDGRFQEKDVVKQQIERGNMEIAVKDNEKNSIIELIGKGLILFGMHFMSDNNYLCYF